MSEHSTPERAWWSSVQRALGLGPILLFAVYHLWAQWPALYGREAWLDRAQRHGLGSALGVVVLALFAFHAVLGLARRAQPAPSSETRSRHSFQRVTGLALIGFTLYHLTHVWPRPDGEVVMLDSSYARLWELLGQPLVLAAYVMGCGALAGHAALALDSLLEPRLPERAHLPMRLIAGLGGLVLFALYLQVIGQYAAGEPMLPHFGAG